MGCFTAILRPYGTERTSCNQDDLFNMIFCKVNKFGSKFGHSAASYHGLSRAILAKLVTSRFCWFCCGTIIQHSPSNLSNPCHSFKKTVTFLQFSLLSFGLRGPLVTGTAGPSVHQFVKDDRLSMAFPDMNQGYQVVFSTDSDTLWLRSPSQRSSVQGPDWPYDVAAVECDETFLVGRPSTKILECFQDRCQRLASWGAYQWFLDVPSHLARCIPAPASQHPQVLQETPESRPASGAVVHDFRWQIPCCASGWCTAFRSRSPLTSRAHQ